MSGYIKLDKELQNSIRFKRALKAWRNCESRSVTRDERDVTLLVGALARLWSYADSHVRDGDVLQASVTEINELVGVEHFAESLPADWLQVIDAEHIKLPDFLAHNGTSARERHLAAQRQARHRHNKSNAPVMRDATVSHGSNDAIPDHPRPSQRKEKNAREGVPRETFKLTQKLRKCFPAGTYGDVSWLNAERWVIRLLNEGVKAEDLVAAVLAYAMQQQAICNVGTQFIKSPEKFFGTDFWRGPFTVPLSPEDQAKAARDKTEAESMQRVVDNAKSIGCTLTPRPHDTAATFESCVNNWRNNEGRSRKGAPVAIGDLLARGSA